LPDGAGPASEARRRIASEPVVDAPKVRYRLNLADMGRCAVRDGRTQARAAAAGQAPREVSLSVGFTTFPDEIFRAPRSWVERGYPNLTYFNEVDRGGHFAAWEEPELFSTEVRAAFRPLR
jgi:hypothetical protein